MPDAGSSAQPVVIAGIDGSAESASALRWAAAVATSFGGHVEVIAAWEYPASFGFSTVPEDWDPIADMRKVADETVAAVFGGSPPAGLVISIREGGAARVLVEASAAAAMVVVGSRGHGGFSGLLLGSVSASVAEHAACPVLIVHGDKPVPAHTPA